MKGVEEKSKLECMPLRNTFVIERGVLFTKRAAGIAIVAETSKELVDRPIVALWGGGNTCCGIHRGKHWPEDTGDHFAISLGLQTESINHNIQYL